MITANEVSVDFPGTPIDQHLLGQTYVFTHYLKSNPKGFFSGIRTISNLAMHVKELTQEEIQNMFRELKHLGLPALANSEWLDWLKKNYL